MTVTPEIRIAVAGELKKLTDLNLSDDQKQKLSNILAEAHERVAEYKRQNPNASRGDVLRKVATNRTAIRERLVDFLTRDQLVKWDAEVAKGKDFLGQSIAA